MDDVGEHGAGAAGLQRVSTPLEPTAWHGHAVETFWAAPLGKGRFQLRNVPFYAKGLSYNDTVSAQHSEGRLVFTGLVARGGHSTYRVVLSDPPKEMWRRFWSRLQELGCTYERGTEHLVAIDVPPEANIHSVYRILEEGEKAAVWDFEEGHCGHAVDGR